MKHVAKTSLLVLAGILLGSVATLWLTPRDSDHSPTAQRSAIEPGSAIMPGAAATTSSTRASAAPEQPRPPLPPLVYSIFESGTRRHSDGSFGFSDRPAWYYEIKIANLTRASVGPVEIAIAVPTTEYELYILPSSQLRKQDGSAFGPDEVWAARWSTNGAQANVRLDGIDSASAGTVRFAITSNRRPGRAFGQVAIECPEGRFDELTPDQWEGIGWRAVLESK